MVFSFKYKPIRLKSGKSIYRPLIPLTVEAKEKIDVIGTLDSGSDITIIPREIAGVIGVEFEGENEISGIAGIPVKARQGKLWVTFGKGREAYDFMIPVIIPEQEGVSVIIGRAGFFDQFKITFSEAEKRMVFKKVTTIQISN